MKNMIKRIFVFLLALALCFGQAAAVVYAQWDGTQAAEAVNAEAPDSETENACEPDDGVESLERSNADTKNTEELAGGKEHEEQETINEEEQLEEMVDADIVCTAAELKQWCSEHRNSGGRVTLGNNITLTETISISNGNGHIVIDTGRYGLVYNGGCISLSSDLEIIGDGVNVPVLDIQTVIEYGDSWEPGWNDIVRNMNITATGKDGMGGVAVRVRQDDGYSAHYGDYRTEGLIRSYGTGAIGLYLDEPLDAYCFQIEVEGDGSAAVYAPQGAKLYYCKLTAEGAGASVVSGSSEIVVDTCSVSPKPLDAQVVNYRIIGVSGSRLYYPVEQNGDISIGDLEYYITFLLSAGEGHPSVTQAFSIDWQLDSIDTSVLGRITIQGSFDPPFQGLGLEDDFPLELIVDVRDPDIPCISDINFKEDTKLGSYVYLNLWDTYDRDDDNVILWRSDDGGESWYDFSDSPDIEWTIEWFGSRIYYYYGEITGSVMLQLEVFGKGESNVVTLSSFDGEVFGDPGGDRDGGDRKIVSGSNNGNASGSNNGIGSGNSAGDNDSSNGENSSGNGNSIGTSVGSSSGSKSDNDSGSGNKVSTAIPTTSTQNGSGLISVYADVIQETAAAAAETETAAPPEEWEDGDTVAISGRRLAAMIEANPKAVTFIKNGIQISVSPTDLLALGLGENQLFMVEIKILTGSSFSVLFKVDNIELSDLPFVVYIGEAVFASVPLASAVCVDENGDILPSEYDPDTGKLSVSMTGPGVFTLQAAAPTEADAIFEPSSTFGAGIIAIGICAVSLPAGVFVWRKRRLKSGDGV